MSGVKHTPGPLEIFPERDRQWLWVMDELGTKRVARVVLYDGLEGEMEANARLIAAAPDLFEVAVKSHEPYEGLSEDDIRSLYGPEEAELALSLRAALSKATAQQEGR